MKGTEERVEIEGFIDVKSKLYRDGKLYAILQNEIELLRARLDVAQKRLEGYTVEIGKYLYEIELNGLLTPVDDNERVEATEYLSEVFGVAFEIVRKMALLQRDPNRAVVKEKDGYFTVDRDEFTIGGKLYAAQRYNWSLDELIREAKERNGTLYVVEHNGKAVIISNEG